jgi:hypothetical protein
MHSDNGVLSRLQLPEDTKSRDYGTECHACGRNVRARASCSSPSLSTARLLRKLAFILTLNYSVLFC